MQPALTTSCYATKTPFLTSWNFDLLKKGSDVISYLLGRFHLYCLVRLSCDISLRRGSIGHRHTHTDLLLFCSLFFLLANAEPYACAHVRRVSRTVRSVGGKDRATSPSSLMPMLGLNHSFATSRSICGRILLHLKSLQCTSSCWCIWCVFEVLYAMLLIIAILPVIRVVSF